MIAGNWKLNLTESEGVALVEGITAAAAEVQAEVVVCPTAIGLSAAAKAADGSRVQVGAQNAYWEESGAFTGEISCSLIKAIGATHVILGHSERRQYFGETDETINKRLKAVLAAGLVPIVCIGETLEERDAGKLEDVLSTQIKGGLLVLSADELKHLVVVAYEPVWAIGTGRVATDEQAQAAHAFVRSVVARLTPHWLTACACYTVAQSNQTTLLVLLGQPDIDGALVGGASLKADAFSGIISAAG